jgi:hypothetical protein
VAGYAGGSFLELRIGAVVCKGHALMLRQYIKVSERSHDHGLGGHTQDLPESDLYSVHSVSRKFFQVTEGGQYPPAVAGDSDSLKHFKGYSLG